jgi:TolB-like protein/class 3 adenylate cyclase/Tfp pilus assembly protein PilF
MSDQSTQVSSRRLAAILFADMVGYTALMQKDEEKASLLLRRFQKEIESTVANQEGQVVNFYGDGALCIFQSPLQALRCSMALQVAFRKEPIVPVRMGVHSGTVVLEGEKVFGDSINLASRIESMGVSGSLLFSRKIRDEIKNQPDLQIEALGSFTFKNVEEPMEVFALANQGFIIPEKTTMEGKFAPLNVESGRMNVRHWILGIGLAIILGGVFFLIYQKIKKESFTPAEKSIAVLPFKDLSSDQDQAYFSEGIAEEILLALSKIDDLKVAGRISSFSFKDQPEATIKDIGRKLNVSTILNGSVRKHENKIRVTTDLVNVSDGFQIWSERYDMELKNIFSLQETIARNIVQKFRLSQLRGVEKPLFSNQSDNPEAYEYYLRAKYYINKSSDGTLDAIDAFKNAIRIDPDYVSAYNGLADAYFQAAIYGQMPNALALEKLKEASTHALRIDPDSEEAYARLGYYYFYGKGDWDQAQSNFEKAVALGFGEGDYYMAMSLLNPSQELLDRAIVGMQKEVDKDPLSITALLGLNRVLLHDRRFREVIQNSQKIFELDPSQRSSLRHIGVAYMFSGRPESALPYFEEAIKNKNYTFYNYILCLVKLDRKEEAERKYEEVRSQLSNYSKAVSSIAIGNLDSAFRHLEEARLEKSPNLLFIRVDPHFEAIRSDPRYLKLEQKMKFPG